VVAQVVADSAVALDVSVTVVPKTPDTATGGVVPAFIFTGVVTSEVVACPVDPPTVPGGIGIPLAFTVVPRLPLLPPLLPPGRVAVVV
jgi:hypothetical protein